ncbi:2-octaprenyl-6-methoxyphenyl hydroxylase [Rhodobacteraceae bacterium WD3A24]|nr:2-octaprenyl-6-methoxyphenyl hydroxylase [Rhodobacteraceae bacterium WD3A24]
MTRERCDIFISGGGVAGLTAAAAFGAAGWRVICADPASPVTDAAARGADLRTTALLQPSVALLERIGLWPGLAAHAAPLEVMRIVDAGGPTAEPRTTHDFDAADISDRPFGWNLPNWLLRREILGFLDSLPSVSFRPGVGTKSVVARETAALIGLSDGTRVEARLLVAADGRDSPVREALGIGARTMRYGQKALAFAVSHPVPHGNVSTEIHRSGGPFTLVPLPDDGGRPRSAVVWMETGPEIRRLTGLPADDFEAEMSARSAWLFGPLALASPLSVWPIISQIADRFAGERTALMAEAAHVVPPIGAQGLNMSLADLGLLLDLAEAAPGALGTTEMLERYHHRRWPEARLRVAGIDMLNRASMMEARPLRDARAAALHALYSAGPVRRTLMRLGMGAGRKAAG